MKRILPFIVITLSLAVIPSGMTHAASKANGRQAAVGQQSVAAIPGWPPRAPVLEVTCPGVSVCFAVGSLPEPDPLPARPPAVPPGGLIAHTDDSGANWTIRSDPRTVFGGIACPSPTRCYVMTARYRLQRVTAHVQRMNVRTGISVTGDGGKTWREHPVPAGANEALACPGITTCGLGGYVVPGRSPKAGVLITADGGKTWKASRTVAQGRPNVARLACPTIRICYLYGGFTGTSISKSEDGGVTWRALPGTDMFALSGVPPRALAGMGGIACPSATVCYTAQGDARCQCDAWGPYGTIIGTQDGGKQWHELYRAHGRDYPLGSIVCPGVSVCYVVGSTQRDTPADGIILSTKDGGRTWAKQKLAVGPSLSCPSVSVCYAGVRYRTTDGGATWQPLP